ncbi:MAG: F0F1 ATP synthase subunit delta, partial [Sporichthyaceae bacterium]
MRGASRAALAASIERYDSVAGGLDGLGLNRLSDELFAVLHVVDTEHGLRRSLSDPTRDGSAKAEVAQVLFEGKISSEALGLVQTVASQRWSRGSEMADAIEYLAVL